MTLIVLLFIAAPKPLIFTLEAAILENILERTSVYLHLDELQHGETDFFEVRRRFCFKIKCMLA